MTINGTIRPTTAARDVISRMPVRPLKSFLPNADSLLSLDLPRLGAILLIHLNSYENRVKQSGLLNPVYLRGMLDNENMYLGPMPKEPEYGARQPEVTRAVIEAWNWLERNGLVIEDSFRRGWYRISRAGEELLRNGVPPANVEIQPPGLAPETRAGYQIAKTPQPNL
jgi:hypothetical protein